MLGGILVRASAAKAFDAVKTARNAGDIDRGGGTGTRDLCLHIFFFAGLSPISRNMVTNITETSATLTSASGDLTMTSDHLADKAAEMSGRSDVGGKRHRAGIGKHQQHGGRLGAGQFPDHFRCFCIRMPFPRI